MLGGSGFAVFVGRECCVKISKRLKGLKFLLSLRCYAAVRDYYTAELRYKLS